MLRKRYHRPQARLFNKRSRQFNGVLFRFLIAGVIALISLISYFTTSEDNPFTGEAQRVALSPEQEIALGLQAAPQMAAQHGGLLANQSAQEHVDQIGARLTAAVETYVARRQGDNPYRFEFHLLADRNTVNAFALPGGQVFITAALYERLETEGQLAGVLGHEVGHVLMRHGAQRLAKQKLTQGLVGAAGVAGGSAESAQMAAAVGQLVNMKYGRDDELESDRWGVELTALAGYDPRSMIGVMKILDEAGAGGPPEMLSTHPKPANRVQYIKAVIAEAFPDGVPDGLKP